MTFDQAFDLLMRHEGGFSSHAADPGKDTMFGITETVARAYNYAGDMCDLPIDLAKYIYYTGYWQPCRCDELPTGVRFDVFDAAVNSGPGQAAKWLQRTLGVREDGTIGPQTLAAAHAATGLAKRFNGQRLMFMTGLSTWAHFSKGWARRIATNLMADT